jgi:hypothetical protein
MNACRGVRASPANRPQSLSLGPRKPVLHPRQFLEQTLQRGGQERKLHGGELRERNRFRRTERIPGGRRLIEHLGRHLPASRPERLQLVRCQLTEPVERRLPGERVDDDRLQRPFESVGQRQDVDQLELVVEIVLEPEHDATPIAQRRAKLLVSPLE